MTDQRSSRSRRKKPSLFNEVIERRMLLYSLAAGAAMAYAPMAHAEVLFTRSNAIVTDGTSFAIDMDHDGVTDFHLINSFGWIGSSTSGRSFWQRELNIHGARKDDQIGVRRVGFAAALKAGEKIDSGRMFSQTQVLALSIQYGVPEGYFLNAFNRYLGVTLLIDGEIHYGWIGFRRVADFVVTFAGWAYETQPDTPIRAGDMGTPGTEVVDHTQPTSLGMLANGHAATQNWRARTSRR